MKIRQMFGGITFLVSVYFHAPAQACTPPPSDLVGWWQGEGNALDIVGGNNGILTNGVTFTGGVVGQAFSLDTSGSESPEITPDGRYVAFYSTATNLVSGVTTSGEIYVRDLVAGTTIWASANARSLFQSVTGGTNEVSCNFSISADGQFVGFEACTNPPSGTTMQGIILRYKVQSGTTDLVYTNALVAAGSFAICVVPQQGVKPGFGLSGFGL